MATTSLIQVIVVLGIIAGALVFLLRRVIKTMRGHDDCDCGCGRCKNNQSNRTCEF